MFGVDFLDTKAFQYSAYAIVGNVITLLQSDDNTSKQSKNHSLRIQMPVSFFATVMIEM